MSNSSPTSRLVDLALEVKDDIVDAFAPSSNPVCELCGAKKYQTKQLPYKATVEHYGCDCIRDGCEGSLVFPRYVIEVGDAIPIRRTDTPEFECPKKNCPVDQTLSADIANRRDPYGVEEHHLPLKGIVTTSTHEHHTSYVPEETINLCSQCHSKVHHDDDFRPDLQPEMSRSEWEELKDE